MSFLEDLIRETKRQDLFVLAWRVLWTLLAVLAVVALWVR